MSVLEKVQREKMGLSESPHVAHSKEWAEAKAAPRKSAAKGAAKEGDDGQPPSREHSFASTANAPKW